MLNRIHICNFNFLSSTGMKIAICGILIFSVRFFYHSAYLPRCMLHNSAMGVALLTRENTRVLRWLYEMTCKLDYLHAAIRRSFAALYTMCCLPENSSAPVMISEATLCNRVLERALPLLLLSWRGFNVIGQKVR